jgi:putative endonuclease
MLALQRVGQFDPTNGAYWMVAHPAPPFALRTRVRIADRISALTCGQASAISLTAGNSSAQDGARPDSPSLQPNDSTSVWKNPKLVRSQPGQPFFALRKMALSEAGNNSIGPLLSIGRVEGHTPSLPPISFGRKGRTVTCHNLRTMPGRHPLFVYMLRCRDDSLYVGQTENITQRLRDHSAGKACHHTCLNRPVILVYLEGPLTLSSASARERQLKGWSRKKKAHLISLTVSRCAKLRSEIIRIGAGALGGPPNPSIVYSVSQLREMLSFVKCDAAWDNEEIAPARPAVD